MEESERERKKEENGIKEEKRDGRKKEGRKEGTSKSSECFLMFRRKKEKHV